MENSQKPCLLTTVRPLVWSVAAFLSFGTAPAALLFQDRHIDAGEQETVYSFETNVKSVNAVLDQSKAAQEALAWAKTFYRMPSFSIANVQARTMPMHFWLVALNAAGPATEKNPTYFAIVLPDGSLVEPKVSRQNLTATANPIDVTKDTELEAPIKGLEVHGEVVFEYGWGKGLRCYGPYAPSPVWNTPPLARPAP